MANIDSASTEPAAGKLASLSIASESNANGSTTNTSSSAQPSKFNWADEVTTPVNELEKQTGADKNEKTGSEAGPLQADGATSYMGGSAGLDEPEFDVNVKLADLQDDPNNPLYSAKSFEELNL